MAGTYVRWAPDLDPQMLERGHARQLGHLENYFVSIQRQRLYTNFSFSCELSSFGNKVLPITHASIAKALRYTMFENPLLLTTLIEKYDDKTFYSKPDFLNTPYSDDFDYMKVVNNVELKDVLINLQPEYEPFIQAANELLNSSNDNGANTQEKMMELCNRLIVPYNKPEGLHWRLYWVENSNQFFCFTDHISWDGMSMVNFFKDFCAGLNQSQDASSTANNTQIFNYKADHSILRPLPLPAEKMVYYKMRVLGLPRFICSEIIKAKLVHRNHSASIKQIEVDKNQDNGCLAKNMTDQFIFRNFSIEKINEILQKCRSLNITITPMLQACWVKALYELGEYENRYWNEWFTDIVITSSAREYVDSSSSLKKFDEKDYKIGSLMAGSSYPYLIHEIMQKNVLDLSKSYNSTFVMAKEKGHYIEGLGVFMQPFLYDKQNLDKVQLERHIFPGSCKSGLMIGNLGYHKFGPASKETKEVEEEKDDHFSLENSFVIKDLKFIQGTASFTKSYVMNIISTDLSGMNFVFSCDKKVFAKPSKTDNTDPFTELVDRFFSKIEEFLLL
ncbi:hypothetical protein ACO0QE_001755 [Hanseniaspora vineae]